jgi:NitT/TauT family transport system substrate-binding protein
MNHQSTCRIAWRCVAAALVSCFASIAAARADELSVPNYGNSISGAPYAVALDKGMFKAAGADVTAIRGTAGGSADVRNMLAGDLPFVESSLSGVLAAVKHGADLRIIGEMAHTNAQFVWVVTRSSALQTPADLKGHRISFTTPQSTSQALDYLLLDRFGYPPGTVSMIATGPYGAALTALENGGVDAALVAEPVYTLNQARLRPLGWVRELFPPVNNTVAVTSARIAHERPDELRAILAAHRQAVDFIAADRDAATAIIARIYKLDPTVVRPVIDGLLDNTGDAHVPFWGQGDLNPADLDAMVRGLRLMGAPEADVDWRKLVDQSFLPDDLRRSLN